MTFLTGRKTYLVVILMVIYAASGWYLKYLPADQAIQVLFTAAGIAGLRKGITEDILKKLP